VIAARSASTEAPALAELAFPAMGTEIRLLASPAAPLVGVHAELLDWAARLSRFRNDSELCALNADPRDAVRVSRDLAHAVSAAVLAARQTEGLVDPTLLDALEDAGYGCSRVGAPVASLSQALGSAPARRAARPDPRARWRAVRVDPAASLVRRPVGLRLDLAGTAKGLVADRAARILAPFGRFVVDCGGDISVGCGAGEPPHELLVRHPVSGEAPMSPGCVAARLPLQASIGVSGSEPTAVSRITFSTRRAVARPGRA
jgi:thiamine biosynthesis lipoprotein